MGQLLVVPVRAPVDLYGGPAQEAATVLRERGGERRQEVERRGAIRQSSGHRGTGRAQPRCHGKASRHGGGDQPSGRHSPGAGDSQSSRHGGGDRFSGLHGAVAGGTNRGGRGPGPGGVQSTRCHVAGAGGPQSSGRREASPRGEAERRRRQSGRTRRRRGNDSRGGGRGGGRQPGLAEETVSLRRVPCPPQASSVQVRGGAFRVPRLRRRRRRRRRREQALRPMRARRVLHPLPLHGRRGGRLQGAVPLQGIRLQQGRHPLPLGGRPQGEVQPRAMLLLRLPLRGLAGQARAPPCGAVRGARVARGEDQVRGAPAVRRAGVVRGPAPPAGRGGRPRVPPGRGRRQGAGRPPPRQRGVRQGQRRGRRRRRQASVHGRALGGRASGAPAPAARVQLQDEGDGGELLRPRRRGHGAGLAPRARQPQHAARRRVRRGPSAPLSHQVPVNDSSLT